MPVASLSCVAVHATDTLYWRRTAICSVDACRVYRFLKQLVTSSPLDMW